MSAALLLLMLAPPETGPPEELVAVYEQAQSAAPEVAAEALLRLAGDARWPADLKVTALTEAFEKGALAREGYPVVLARGRPAAGPASWRVFGSRLGLDRLTSQSRAVMGLSRLAPAAARKLFEQMPYPVWKPLTCQDEAAPDPRVYFQAAAAVAARGYTAAERRKEQHVTLLMGVVGRIRSAMELAPAAEMVRQAGLEEGQRAALMTQLRSVMQTLTSDDRTFTTALADTAGMLRQGPDDEVFQGWLMRHLKQARCRDTVEDAAFAYQLRAAYGVVKTVEPETVLDAPPATAQEAPAQGEWVRRAMELQRDLRRDSFEWRNEVEELLSAAETRPAGADDPARSLLEKATVMLPLLKALSGQGARDRAMMRLAAMIGNDPLQQEQFLTWLAVADETLRRSVTVDPYAHRPLLEAFERTAPPALALWAKLERLMPRGAAAP